MSFPVPPFENAVTPKELAYYLPARDARWVARECGLGNIKTLPVGRPYMIPAIEANRVLGLETNDNDRHTSTHSNTH